MQNGVRILCAFLQQALPEKVSWKLRTITYTVPWYFVKYNEKLICREFQNLQIFYLSATKSMVTICT